jgi:hypothetical protein
MKRAIEETAILVAVLLKRAKAKRARISEKTIRVLSRRRTLRVAFLSGLVAALDDLGVHMVELERGGFGLIPISALDGAPSILAKNYLREDLKQLRQGGEKVIAKLKAEVTEDGEGDETED